ncbi:hypothetical protein H920_15166 [Fukomys damarensis]|uniref:Uncharacterized protein n=1 Tax=Fukomys damarensis TaxID=885580 RepID=A0A091DKR5_FUKDA|nr:hypothetical protein H920_15166 [Fukomys damarensis]
MTGGALQMGNPPSCALSPAGRAVDKGKHSKDMARHGMAFLEIGRVLEMGVDSICGQLVEAGVVHQEIEQEKQAILSDINDK